MEFLNLIIQFQSFQDVRTFWSREIWKVGGGWWVSSWLEMVVGLEQWGLSRPPPPPPIITLRIAWECPIKYQTYFTHNTINPMMVTGNLTIFKDNMKKPLWVSRFQMQLRQKMGNASTLLKISGIRFRNFLMFQKVALLTMWCDRLIICTGELSR